MGAVALSRWPLIGRRELIDRFLDALDDPDAGGFLVVGDAGVGKTRLADECLLAAERSGSTVGRAIANSMAATMPLGAIAQLLPAPPGRPTAPAAADPIALFEHAREVLADPAGQRRYVLFVDDVNLLDATSAVLLAQLLSAGVLFLVATVRAGDPVPDLITSLWRDHRVDRVDLQPLDRNSVDTLLHLVLGGPIRAGSSIELWEACRGNALFLHELVLGALESGSLSDVDGIWHLEGLDMGGARLREIVERRVGLVDGPSRDVLERLALCEPLGLSDLESQVGLEVIEHLERAGLIQVTSDRRRQLVRVSHPMHAEVLRRALSRSQARRVLLEQAEQIEAHGARRQDDALRIATWRLDADGHADVDLLVQAARLARAAQDFTGAERLARAAHETAPSAEAALILGEALYELARFDESEAVLDAATGLPADGPTLLLLASTRAKNLFWGQLDPERALSILRRARDGATAAERDELITEEASIHTFTNRPVEALTIVDGVTGDDARTQALRALVRAPALTAVGRCLEAVEVAARGFEVHMALDPQLAIAHPGSHIVAQTFALADAGRLDEAERLARAGYEVAAADRSLIAQIWFCLNLGRIQVAQGRLGESRRWYVEGVALARRSGFDGPRRLGLAGIAVVAASLADGPAARTAIAELDDLPPFAFLLAEQETGRAWAEAAAGEPVRAAQVLVDAAAEARRVGASMAEARVWHELGRLGGAARAVERLAELATVCDSPLVVAWSVHADALARGEAASLRDLVDTFEGLGTLLVAAETATAAADAYKRRQEQRSASAMSERAGLLARRCDGARTPGLRTTDSVVALSGRELEVAGMAADGLASKAIAERLYLSVRTVNNHLQRVYTKLGVSTRAELSEALLRRGEPPSGGAT